MYAWKCWRDSRDRVILYAAASLAVGILTGIFISSWYRVDIAMAWRWNPRFGDWNPALWAWSWGMEDLDTYLSPASLWVAAVLGAVSVGREYGSGAMPFLLTRPARRKSFVWTEWGLGLAEMTTILTMMFVGFLPFIIYTSHAYIWRSWPVLTASVLVGTVIYGLTQFMTVLTGTSLKGLVATCALGLFYVLLPGALQDWWHISGPLKFKNWSLNISAWNWHDDLFVVHGWPMLMWLVVAIAFPLLSQFVLERREV